MQPDSKRRREARRYPKNRRKYERRTGSPPSPPSPPRLSALDETREEVRGMLLYALSSVFK